LPLPAGLSAQAASAQTLKTVQDRAWSRGVSQGLPGFFLPDDKGNWTGLDVISAGACAAIFNDATKVKFRAAVGQGPLHGDCSPVKSTLLSRNTTWTLFARHLARRQLHRRDYYDGQGFW